MEALRERVFGAILDREGGFVDHPADRGGPTRWGITRAVARAHGFNGPMRALPRAFALDIYRALYWDPLRLDAVAAMAPTVAAELADTAVNMGPGTAARFLQIALNAFNGGTAPDLATDGIVGPRTLDALAAHLDARGAGRRCEAIAVLLAALNTQQGARYLDLVARDPAQKAFAFGWFAHRVARPAVSPTPD
ncbi:hypothetical protein CCR85_01340 [Rhodothalassium salexigens]|nr:hypothetical protein [Rhodothalassium salexigens]MBK5920758.1 hypothetical protein [Rhodothalassium salexigens]